MDNKFEIGMGIYVIIALLALILFQVYQTIAMHSEVTICEGTESKSCKVFTCPYDTANVNPCNNTPFKTTDGITFYCEYNPTNPVTLG